VYTYVGILESTVCLSTSDCVDCFKCAYVIINGCRYSLASSSSLRPSDASPVDITWTSAAHTRLLDLIAGDPLVVGWMIASVAHRPVRSIATPRGICIYWEMYRGRGAVVKRLLTRWLFSLSSFAMHHWA